MKITPDGASDGPTEFVLKVLNAVLSSYCPGAVATQTDILLHLKSFPELKCQVPVATADGKILSYEMIRQEWKSENRSRDDLSAVRLYAFLPGRPLHDVSPLPPPFFYKVGCHLGDLQLALQKFQGDIEPLKQKADVHAWCLTNVTRVHQHLNLIPDAGRRSLVEEVLKEFTETVLPVHGELRQGIVHHDLNEYNLLLTPATCESEGVINQTSGCSYDISGIIDFDEMCYTCLVYEIAVSMMYFMLCTDQPLELIAYLLAGFESRAPLPANERRLLKVLTCGRLVQSLVLGLAVAQSNQDNSPCVLSTQVRGWECLELLWGQKERDLMAYWDSMLHDETD